MLVSSLMADYAYSSSKLSVASRASQCHESAGGPIILALRSLLFFSASQFLFFHRELP